MPELRIGETLALPLDAVTRAWAIVGQRGTGKTSTAVVLVEEAAGAGAQVAVIDPTGAWYGLRTSASGKGPGLEVVVFGGHNGDLPLEHTAGPFIARLVIEQHLNVVLDLELMTKAKQVQFVAEFAETLYHENRTALTLVIDEAHRFAPQQLREPGGFGARCLGAVTDVVTLGRRKGLGAVLISQRPAKINKDVFEQAEVMVIHRLLGPNDRKAIAGWLEEAGDPPQGSARATDVMSREVPRLAPQQAIVYAPHYEVARLVSVRKKRTFDSSATPEVGATAVAPRGRAQVDLAAIREAMAETIAEAEANDPKLLRQRIAELQRERDEHKGWEEEHASTLTRLEARIEEAMREREAFMRERVEAYRDRFAPLMEEMAAATLRLLQDVPPLEVTADEPRRFPDLEIAARSAEARERTRVEDVLDPRMVKAARESNVGVGAWAGGEDKPLRAGALRMLEAIASLHPVALTRAQVGTLARVKSSGGTFSSYLSALKVGGYIADEGGKLSMTERGWDELGGKPRAPATAAELRDLWRSRLRGGAVRMLDFLIDIHPSGISREDLGNAVEIAHTGGTFSSYLSSLRTAGLVEVNGAGVKAAAILFTGPRGD